MAGQGEVRPRRLTVDVLAHRFGVHADADAAEVTFTSIACRCGDVRPGSLFVPEKDERTSQTCRAAVFNGAYAILLPSDENTRSFAHIGIPILTIADPPAVLGKIGAYLNGDPSRAIAVFVVLGDHCEAIAARLGRMLHHLGNPIGFVGKDGSESLGRRLDTHGRLNAARLQFLESVMVEDGVTALVIAASSGSLQPTALSGTQIDVLFDPSAVRRPGDPALSAADHAPVFGAKLPKAACVSATPIDPSDPRFSVLADVLDLQEPSIACALRMAIDAGISIEAIARAENVAREFAPEAPAATDDTIADTRVSLDGISRQSASGPSPQASSSDENHSGQRTQSAHKDSSETKKEQS